MSVKRPRNSTKSQFVCSAERRFGTLLTVTSFSIISRSARKLNLLALFFTRYAICTHHRNIWLHCITHNINRKSSQTKWGHLSLHSSFQCASRVKNWENVWHTCNHQYHRTLFRNWRPPECLWKHSRLRIQSIHPGARRLWWTGQGVHRTFDQTATRLDTADSRDVQCWSAKLFTKREYHC